MCNVFRTSFFIIRTNVLIWSIVILTMNFAKADTIKYFAYVSNVGVLPPVEHTWIQCRYPCFGLNNYFFKSMKEIREQEAMALEAEILNTSINKFDDELVELPLEQPHLLGLSGYLQHSTPNQKGFNLIHINFK